MKDIGQEKEAEAALRRAIAIREKLLVEQPKSILARMSLAHSWLKLGAVLHSRVLTTDFAGELVAELCEIDLA